MYLSSSVIVVQIDERSVSSICSLPCLAGVDERPSERHAVLDVIGAAGPVKLTGTGRPFVDLGRLLAANTTLTASDSTTLVDLNASFATRHKHAIRI